MTLTLTELRLDAGFSIQALSKEAGVSASTISRLERGLVAPTLLTAHRIAKALGTTAERIEFGGRQ